MSEFNKLKITEGVIKVKGLKSDLVALKGKLTQLYARQNLDEFDIEQLDYLINLIDDLLLGKQQLNTETFNILIEDVVSTAVMQVSFDLLDFVKPYCGEDYGKIQL